MKKIIFLAALTNAIINIFLIPLWGIEGAALATTLSYILVWAISLYKLTCYVPLKVPFKHWLTALLPLIAFCIVILAISEILSLNLWLELLISSFFGSLLYLFLSYLFGTINFQEIKQYTKLIFKNKDESL